ncbi:HsmA family protein [Paraclostridium sordellii]|uniref:HsmA family protein n=1 Tax=Paraclostridium sordellii TaxID=1505 RepID=UPI0005DF4392|nr:HsmA family protein [Paeniclostridium sordellii]CEO23735.1 membrane protein [[Clostridium] sordellii] [Paeniclostridium sordellii]CEP83919.1 membrane protein [[Clostridium] sordellii] [Paeniclostridium sordellii]CEP89701.1 membrane protein [[Clostridium] sordellii] [Paeniclostridium sordellii]CEQ08598.1 membrane protein [[Clostridium] sordellii] [Paeniclostridium sordellii]CEQ11568.1 membrane protein [[Clostridium] sordellii] [Paeniclostridium sordellii]
MSTKLIFAIITITLALVFYTVGVFSERKAKKLKKSHVVIFYLGLICDTTGTSLMSQIAKSGNINISSTAQTIHGVTGTIAILLMLFHAVWATWVIYKNDEEKQLVFHKFSIVVWFLWLIPYIIGAIIGMMH